MFATLRPQQAKVSQLRWRSDIQRKQSVEWVASVIYLCSSPSATNVMIGNHRAAILPGAVWADWACTIAVATSLSMTHIGVIVVVESRVPLANTVKAMDQRSHAPVCTDTFDECRGWSK